MVQPKRKKKKGERGGKNLSYVSSVSGNRRKMENGAGWLGEGK